MHAGINMPKVPVCRNCYHEHWAGNIVDAIEDMYPEWWRRSEMASKLCAGCGSLARYYIGTPDPFKFWLCKYCLENRYPQNIDKAIDMSEMYPKCQSCGNPATLAVHQGINLYKALVCQTCYRERWSPAIVESLDDLIPGRRKMTFDKVQDSGAREEFSTGSRRDTQTGKGRPDLIPPYPMERLAKHYENGANKYGDRNWEKGQPLMRYIASAKRHIIDIEKGMTDEDHFAAVIWNIMSFMHTQYMIERHVLPQELDNYTESVAQHRAAEEFEHLKAVGEEPRYKGIYDGLGLISESRREELDRVEGMFEIPATKTEGSEQFIPSDVRAEANQRELDKQVGIVVLGPNAKEEAERIIATYKRVWGIGLNHTYMECMESILKAEDLEILRKKSWK